ncbi:hypothetical protein OIV83_006391, partial [Microbotryomycetes sp. JL201]
MSKPEMMRAESETEKFHLHNVEDVVQSGQAATDIHGHALVEIDPKAERALVYAPPNLSLCFDRVANFQGAFVRRNVDIIIFLSVLFCYIMCFRIAGFEAGIGLRPTDYGGHGYNLVLTAFYIGYIASEPFASYVAKFMGPGTFLATITVVFGFLSFATAYVRTFGQAVAVRTLLGIMESGFFPMTAFFLSRFYKKRSELSFRLGIYLIFAPLSGACGGLLASGFLACPGFGMIRGWRIIFWAEGLITIGAGLI